MGFYTDAAVANDGQSDTEILRGIECARLFGSAASQFVTEEVIDYLRPGDVLVVADIARLASSLESMMKVVERLHTGGIAIHAVRNNITPNSAVGDAFGSVCALLARFCRDVMEPKSKIKPGQRRRGRPIALRPDDQQQAERLLKRASVLEVARLLSVSPATLYRYFPRKRTMKKLIPHQERVKIMKSPKRGEPQSNADIEA